MPARLSEREVREIARGYQDAIRGRPQRADPCPAYQRGWRQGRADRERMT